MRRTAIGFVAVALLVMALPAAAQTPPQVTTTRDGAPARNVQVDLQFLNQPKMRAGVTPASGILDFTLGMANRGKPVRMQVVIYDCPNDQSVVVFVEAGAEIPENPGCKRRVLGWIWFGRARAVVIDVARGTMQVQGGQSFLGSTRGKLIAGGGAAVVGIGLLTAGGGDSGQPGQGTAFDPSGNYPVTNTVSSDPGGHRTPIAMEGSTVLVISVTGTTIRITCPPGSKWTIINGTFNNGQITGEGRGPAAGFSNVLYRFTGTISLTGSSQGTLTGSLTVGAGGEFPGGQPTVFAVSGRKQ